MERARDVVGRGFISSTNRLTYAACAPIITSAIRLSRALLRVSTRLLRVPGGEEKKRRSTTRVSKNAAASRISTGVYCFRDDLSNEENNKRLIIYAASIKGREARKEKPCFRSKGETATKCLIFGISPSNSMQKDLANVREYGV